MKKLALFLIAALLINVLAGCQGAMGSAPQTPPPVETTGPVNEPTTPADPTIAETSPVSGETEDLISREEAKKIALDNAQLKESEVYELEVELDRDNGALHYDVDFEVGGQDYDYEIDAKTGKILRSEIPAKNSGGSNTNKNDSEKKELTASEARDIALKHAGLKAGEVRDLEVELDRDGGRKHFDVSFEKDGYDYEYEIDTSGKILKSEKERD